MACDQPEQIDQAHLDRLITIRCPERMLQAGFIFRSRRKRKLLHPWRLASTSDRKVMFIPETITVSL
jgi:hypothetical protein